jgi:hypothetical protein
VLIFPTYHGAVHGVVHLPCPWSLRVLQSLTIKFMAGA